MKKILFIAGSRGEYGYIRPIINKIKTIESLDYEVLVTNMHLLPKFGNTKNDFIKDNININYEIYNTLDGYNNITMVKSLGIFLLQIPEILDKSKPDFILISGDRGEQFMSVIAASHMNIPVIHIQAGEKSGNIDGIVRHSITKLAHIHLCSNQDAYERVIKLGEEKFRVKNVGAPQLDELQDKELKKISINFLKKKYSLNNFENYILVVFHPVTEDLKNLRNQINLTMKFLNKENYKKIVILPNNDAGSDMVKEAMYHHRDSNYVVFDNLPRFEYLSFLKNCSFMIGNSSSGIIEAASFKKGVINIGRRQNKRLKSFNVISLDKINYKNLYKSISKLKSSSFAKKLNKVKNPYGDGKSSERIINLLLKTEINQKLLQKNITY